MRAGRQKNTILVCFVFQRKTSHFQIFSYARGGLGREGNISTSTAWRPLSLELFQLSPLTSRQIVIAWCASGRIEYGERQNVVKEEFHFESATQPFELTDEIATIVFNRLFTFVIKNKLEREREREGESHHHDVDDDTVSHLESEWLRSRSTRSAPRRRCGGILSKNGCFSASVSVILCEGS